MTYNEPMGLKTLRQDGKKIRQMRGMTQKERREKERKKRELDCGPKINTD